MSSPVAHHLAIPGGSDSSEAFFDYSQRLANELTYGVSPINI